METLKILGERLRLLRKEKRQRQIDIAEILEIFLQCPGDGRIAVLPQKCLVCLPCLRIKNSRLVIKDGGIGRSHHNQIQVDRIQPLHIF